MKAEGQDGWPEGYGRRVLEEVDSTNAEAARLAAELSGPTWILGLRQTAGRGRRGRPWADPGGNFAATLLLRPSGAPERAALRSFVAALALADALAEVIGSDAGLALKWPNDVLLNGGKLSGILLESAGQGGGLSHLAIGIGVNLRHAPPADAVESGAWRPVSLLDATRCEIGPEAFLDVLARSYARRETLYCTYGFGPIRKAWLARAARLGEQIVARTARGETRGRFETVDEAGNLVLCDRGARVILPAADVFFDPGEEPRDAAGD